MEHANVLISDEGLFELDGKRKVLSVPRSTIESIRLLHGIQSERPLVQSAFGLILIGIGLTPLRWVVSWVQEGGVLTKEVLLLCLTIPIGLWMLWAALAPGYYLLVTSTSGTRKIAFARNAPFSEIHQLLKDANEQLGYAIQIET
jgi:hypothetical protein